MWRGVHHRLRIASLCQSVGSVVIVVVLSALDVLLRRKPSPGELRQALEETVMLRERLSLQGLVVCGGGLQSLPRVSGALWGRSHLGFSRSAVLLEARSLSHIRLAVAPGTEATRYRSASDDGPAPQRSTRMSRDVEARSADEAEGGRRPRPSPRRLGRPRSAIDSAEAPPRRALHQCNTGAGAACGSGRRCRGGSRRAGLLIVARARAILTATSSPTASSCPSAVEA